MRRPRHGCSGFTVAEMLIASVIMVLLGAVTWTLFVSMQRTWSTAETNIQTSDQARLGLQALLKDVRQATVTTLQFPAPAAPSAPVSLPVNAAGTAPAAAAGITFRLVDGTQLRYYLETQPDGRRALRRADLGGGTAITVAHDLTQVDYMCPEGCGIAGGGSAVEFAPLIEFRLIAQRPALLAGGGSSLPVTTQFRGQVAVRNIQPAGP